MTSPYANVSSPHHLRDHTHYLNDYGPAPEPPYGPYNASLYSAPSQRQRVPQMPNYRHLPRGPAAGMSSSRFQTFPPDFEQRRHQGPPDWSPLQHAPTGYTAPSYEDRHQGASPALGSPVTPIKSKATTKALGTSLSLRGSRSSGTDPSISAELQRPKCIDRSNDRPTLGAFQDQQAASLNLSSASSSNDAMYDHPADQPGHTSRQATPLQKRKVNETASTVTNASTHHFPISPLLEPLIRVAKCNKCHEDLDLTEFEITTWSSCVHVYHDDCLENCLGDCPKCETKSVQRLQDPLTDDPALKLSDTDTDATPVEELTFTSEFANHLRNNTMACFRLKIYLSDQDLRNCILTTARLAFPVAAKSPTFGTGSEYEELVQEAILHARRKLLKQWLIKLPIKAWIRRAESGPRTIRMIKLLLSRPTVEKALQKHISFRKPGSISDQTIKVLRKLVEQGLLNADGHRGLDEKVGPSPDAGGYWYSLMNWKRAGNIDVTSFDEMEALPIDATTPIHQDFKLILSRRKRQKKKMNEEAQKTKTIVKLAQDASDIVTPVSQETVGLAATAASAAVALQVTEVTPPIGLQKAALTSGRKRSHSPDAITELDANLHKRTRKSALSEPLSEEGE